MRIPTAYATQASRDKYIRAVTVDDVEAWRQGLRPGDTLTCSYEVASRDRVTTYDKRGRVKILTVGRHVCQTDHGTLRIVDMYMTRSAYKARRYNYDKEDR